MGEQIAGAPAAKQSGGLAPAVLALQGGPAAGDVSERGWGRIVHAVHSLSRVRRPSPGAYAELMLA